MKKTLLILAFGVLGYFTAFSQSLNCAPLTPCLEEFPVFFTGSNTDLGECPIEICIQQDVDCSERPENCPDYSLSLAPICSKVEHKHLYNGIDELSKVKIWTECGATSTGCKIVTNTVTIQRYSESLGTYVGVTYTGTAAGNIAKLLQGIPAPPLYDQIKIVDCDGNVQLFTLHIGLSITPYGNIGSVTLDKL